MEIFKGRNFLREESLKRYNASKVKQLKRHYDLSFKYNAKYLKVRPSYLVQELLRQWKMMKNSD